MPIAPNNMYSPTRTLLMPGQGITRAEEPVKEQKRYPLIMTHPGFQRGLPDKEIRIVDEATGKWTGLLRYEGGRPARFAPVLVHDFDQEEGHKSQGYVPAQTATPADFAKFVQSPIPTEPHVAIQYPKWVLGRVVHNAEEEAEVLGVASAASGSSEAPAATPAASAEINTRDPALIGVEPAVLGLAIKEPAPVETKDERIARLKAELAELEGATDTRAAPVTAEGIALAVADEMKEVEATPVPDHAAARSMARSEAIKAGLAKRKAAKAAAAAGTAD